MSAKTSDECTWSDEFRKNQLPRRRFWMFLQPLKMPKDEQILHTRIVTRFGLFLFGKINLSLCLLISAWGCFQFSKILMIFFWVGVLQFVCWLGFIKFQMFRLMANQCQIPLQIVLSINIWIFGKTNSLTNILMQFIPEIVNLPLDKHK